MSNGPKRHAIQKDDLFQMRFLQSADLTPDGSLIVYSLSEHHAADDADYHHLWLLDPSNGQSRQLTHGKQRNDSPAIAPDGRSVAFVSDRNGKAQIYLLPLDGGEARRLTDLAQGVAGSPVWSPDGNRIAFTAGPAAQAEPKSGAPYRVTRQVYRYDTIGYLDQELQDIYVTTVTNGETQRLTRGATHDTSPRWSPDGERILFNTAHRPDSLRSLAPELQIVGLDGAVQTVIGYEWGELNGNAAWLPDGERIAFVGHPNDLPIGSKSDLYVLSVDGDGSPENRTPTLAVGAGGRNQADMPSQITRTASPILVTPDGESAFLRVQAGGTLQIYRVVLSGEERWEAVVAGERSCFPLALAENGRTLLFATSSFNEPFDLHVADVGNWRERQLTAFNRDFLAERAQPVVKHLWFTGSDGVDVEGWLLRPDTDGAPFPTVLYIHGGPHSAFGSIYHFDTQMLVGAGYAVLLINHRASTGYGDEFSTAIKGDWGNLDYGDLMAGVEATIAGGWTDPDRLGVCGLSGGGNLSCWIVGQSDRFKAAVPENPVTNWVSFYGVSDIGVWFSVEELGGHPHEIPAVYARCSPITYAHRCRTPTLLVQCEGDLRCPTEQSEQFYNVLNANGCTVEMLRLPDGFHAGAIVGNAALRRAQNDALLDWMNQFVLGLPADTDII